ncbi:hypothetical protein [Acidithiobacillus sulfuriphilus]|uniref:Uncharacterized protein n=2 Tax=Acidithiobacillus sulfuriphilus TaxID=1867749 RepID=A0A3M8QQ26_9PROT|nr:hypothetical protein [Acidithiobacillus sulfuriphilus]RNF57771.1 hypothetical protein EC580_14175 [Acidithiobacillus sulfuriphilus]
MPRPPIHQQPMTARERKREQYQRDQRAVTEAIGNEATAPNKALLSLMGKVDKPEWSERAQIAWEAFGRRYGWIRDTHDKI